MFGVQVCSVVRWLFGCGLVGLLVVLIVLLFCPLLFCAIVLGYARPLLLSRVIHVKTHCAHISLQEQSMPSLDMPVFCFSVLHIILMLPD